MKSSFEGTPSMGTKVEGAEPVNQAEVVSELGQLSESETDSTEKDVTKQNESKSGSFDPKMEEVGNKENTDNNLGQHIKEIQDKASEISSFLNNKENNNLEAINAALKDAEEFMEDKKREMGDAFDNEKNRGKIEPLDIVINVLKQRKEELKKGEEPETAKDFIKVLREEQEKLAGITAYSIRGLRIFEKAEGGEALTEDEQREYDEMKKNGITKAKLTERLRFSTNNNVVAGGMEMAMTALEEARKQAGSSEDFLRYVNALDTTTNIFLERIGIKEKGMPEEEQTQAVEKLEKEEVEGRDYFIGVDGGKILRKDLKKQDKIFFDEVTGNGQEEKIQEKVKTGEGEEGYIEKVDCSIESSSYQHLIDFFRSKTSASEARSEVAKLLFMADKKPLAGKIMALQEGFYIIPNEDVMPDEKKKIEPDADGKGEVGTIVIRWEDTSDMKWRKTIIRVFFEEYEDSGSLSSLRQAVTSREKPISISVLQEYPNIKQNVQEEKQDESAVNLKDVYVDPFGEKINPNEEQKARMESSGAESIEETGSGAESHDNSAGQTAIIEGLSDGDIGSGDVVEIKTVNGKSYEVVQGERMPILREIMPEKQLVGDNNNFTLAVGAGATFQCENGETVRVGMISEKIVTNKFRERTEPVLNRSQMESGDVVTLKEKDGMVYELTMDDKGNVVLKQSREIVFKGIGNSTEDAKKKPFSDYIASFFPEGGVKKVNIRRPDSAV